MEDLCINPCSLINLLIVKIFPKMKRILFPWGCYCKLFQSAFRSIYEILEFLIIRVLPIFHQNLVWPFSSKDSGSPSSYLFSFVNFGQSISRKRKRKFQICSKFLIPEQIIYMVFIFNKLSTCWSVFLILTGTCII